MRAGWLSLAVWILLCLSVGWIGAAATDTGQSAWFQSLRKPSWNPPNALFAPVWTVLYILMGTAAWIIWSHPSQPARTRALSLFLIQLAANFMWTFIFFGAQRIGLALVDIAVLVALIAATLVAFHRLDRRAGWMLVPYLCWVTFATALNLSIWLAN
jgi:benzodiazapine receptor